MKVLIDKLDYKYSDYYALREVALNLSNGEALAILGPNGAGKTTLLRCLNKDLAIAENKVFFNGVDINQFREWEKVGYISQHVKISSAGFPISVREFLLTFEKHNSLDRVNEVAQTINISYLLDKNLYKLSGGEQKRVFIARAMLSELELLILDEPYAAVDKENKHEINQVLSQLKSKGVTILVVTHDLNSISSFIDKICVLNQELKFYGTISSYRTKYEYGE